MTKFVYNTTEIYTLLFKNGNLELRPKKYIPVEDSELVEGSPYLNFEASGQVKIYNKESDIPKEVKETVAAPEQLDPSKGLTEAQFKAEQAKKKTEVYVPPGTVTELGQGDAPKSVATTTTIGRPAEPVETTPETETETSTELGEATPKRGRKPAAPKTPE